MVLFNNNKSKDRLIIEIEVAKTDFDTKESFEYTREEVLSENFTVEDFKNKIREFSNQLSSRDKTRIVNHFVGSYHDYKKYLNEKNIRN